MFPFLNDYLKKKNSSTMMQNANPMAYQQMPSGNPMEPQAFGQVAPMSGLQTGTQRQEVFNAKQKKMNKGMRPGGFRSRGF